MSRNNRGRSGSVSNNGAGRTGAASSSEGRRSSSARPNGSDRRGATGERDVRSQETRSYEASSARSGKDLQRGRHSRPNEAGPAREQDITHGVGELRSAEKRVEKHTSRSSRVEETRNGEKRYSRSQDAAAGTLHRSKADKSGSRGRRSGESVSVAAAAGKRGDMHASAAAEKAPAWAASLPVRQNGEYIADIVGLGHEGEGVGRVEGFTLFVPGALPGERVRVKALKLKKQYGYAKLLDVVQPSADRMSPPCAIYDECGGCQLQHLTYDAQLKHKRQMVVDNLERIGKLQVASSSGEKEGGLGGGIIVHPTLGMTDPWRYRNKAQVPIGLAGAEQGGLVGGFYAQGSHRIIDMDTCLIQHERNDDVVAAVKRIARELGIRPYNEETGQGLLRHVMTRYGLNTGEIMVVLVTNGESLPHQDELIGLIRQDVPGVRSICQNVNTRATNVIFGDRTKVLWGEEVIYDTIGDVRFAISARSFYQVNPVQTEVLYGKALKYAGLTGGETVIDAYCGIGTISLFLARHAREVYGVEVVEEAIDDARRNAELNGIRNVQFEAGPAEVVIPAWHRDGVRADVIVVDPPRKGCDAALLETILEMKPRRVVYVSCNPSTLARDLRILEDGGYSTAEVQPVDMFPHTVHVESVALLVRDGTDR